MNGSMNELCQVTMRSKIIRIYLTSPPKEPKERFWEAILGWWLEKPAPFRLIFVVDLLLLVKTCCSSLGVFFLVRGVTLSVRHCFVPLSSPECELLLKRVWSKAKTREKKKSLQCHSWFFFSCENAIHLWFYRRYCNTHASLFLEAARLAATSCLSSWSSSSSKRLLPGFITT